MILRIILQIKFINELFKKKTRFDTGDIVRQYSVTIGRNETAEELTNRMALLGARLLMECIRDLPRSVKFAVPQSREGVSYGTVDTML